MRKNYGESGADPEYERSVEAYVKRFQMLSEAKQARAEEEKE